MIYNILSAIIIAVLALMVFFVCYRFFVTAKKREDKINYIRSFKKGKCTIIYIASIPIYLMGLIYSGKDIFSSIFTAVNKSLALIVLNPDFSIISALMNESFLFSFATYFCFVLVAINAFLIYISIFHQKIWSNRVKRLWISSKKDRLLIIGNNAENRYIYLSDNNRCKLVLDKFSDSDSTKFFMDGINHISSDDITKEINELIDISRNNTDIKSNVIINIGSDEANLALGKMVQNRLKAEIEGIPEEQRKEYITQLFSRINVYVFGSPDYEALYQKLVNESFGCIHYVNKYKLIAFDFINNYPISKFLPTEYVNRDTTIIPNTNINVALIGFGKTNQQIFLSSVSNNQFLTRSADGALTLKQIKYKIFDKEKNKNNKNLNHTYYRFENEILRINEAEKYLPLPPAPAIVNYAPCNINDPELYDSISELCYEENSVNLAVVAFGSDLENIDLAEKLIEKANEWNVDNLYVFVKVRSGNNAFSVFNNKHCFLIGNEKDIVYNVDKITHDALNEMAKERNRLHALEYNYYSEHIAKNLKERRTPEQIIKDADYDWFAEKSQLERESNVYCILSLRSKLHLLGLDYGKANQSASKATATDFEKAYSSSEIEYYPDHSVNGKKLVKGTTYYTDSPRGILAIQEHYRWNAYMITQGVIPATRDNIINEKKASGSYTNGKNYNFRRHGNITTAEGLIEFRKLIAERNGCSEEDADVIKYDYQLMDDAVWLIQDNGYTLIKKED